MGNAKALEVQKSDETMSPMAKGSVQYIEVEGDEWRDFMQMFQIVGWKRTIPDKLDTLMQNDIETYEVVVYLNNLKSPNAGVVAVNDTENQPVVRSLKLSDIESKDDLIAQCKKDNTFWSRKGTFIETQLGLIKEEMPQIPQNPEEDGGCCSVM